MLLLLRAQGWVVWEKESVTVLLIRISFRGRVYSTLLAHHELCSAFGPSLYLTPKKVNNIRFSTIDIIHLDIKVHSFSEE